MVDGLSTTILGFLAGKQQRQAATKTLVDTMTRPLSPSKPSKADTTNPFISRPPSRPTAASDSAMNSLREGMGRMDVTGRESHLASSTASGSGSVPKNVKRQGSAKELDRFVPSRNSSLSHIAPSLASLDPSNSSRSSSPDSSIVNVNVNDESLTSDLSTTLGVPLPQKRILSFRAAPPPSSSATSHLDLQRQYVRHPTTAPTRTVTGQQSGPSKRRIPTAPDRVLDAPGFANDYYLNLISWSSSNKVAIGLGDIAYVWDAEEGSVNAMGEGAEGEVPVTSVSWAGDGSYLAVGNDIGEVEIWDVDEGKKMRVMAGHNARVASLSWNGHVLTSGCRDGSIHHHDVRVARHKVMELNGHTAEVCGLTWRGDGQLLASGGNDNVVNCWDGRIGQSVLQTDDGVPKGTAKWTKRNHTAAVKALAWCPWQSNLLASGGGTSDQTIHFWSSTTGARTASLPTTSQVTSLVWSPHSKEILSTHGHSECSIVIWAYPSLAKVGQITQAHDERVLGSALSPDGCTVATGAGDENLKFWKIWEAKSSAKAKAAAEDSERDGQGRTKSAVRVR